MRSIRAYIVGGSTYGRLVLLVGLLIGFPLLVLPFNPAELVYAPAFVIPMVLSVAAGFIICIVTYHQQEKVSEYQAPVQRSSLPVFFVWIYSLSWGALPFLLSGQLEPLQALFESVSGWTTTGITLVDVEGLPHILLFYRSFTQYCGGTGFVLMMIMFVRGKQSMNLFSTEAHVEQMMPSLRQTARFIFSIYSIFLAVGTVLYFLAGMDLFDALCHTMSAVSTAGFSSHAGGISAHDSVAIEAITVLLMLLGASNFALLLMFTEGKMRKVFKSTELRFMAGLLALFIPLTAMSLFIETDLSLGQSFRNAIFAVVSAFSTTGYSTMDFVTMPPFALGLLMLLMVIGGSSGSTAGGIKLSRTYFILRITRENIRRRISPAIRTAIPTYNAVRGKVEIDYPLIADTLGFITCYFTILVIGTLLVTLTAGCTLFEGMFEFTSVLGTSGVSSGLVNTQSNPATLIVLMSGMILGRLEIFVVFYGLAASVKMVRRLFQKHSS